MLCEGLRVKGNLGDSEEAREQDVQKSVPQGGGKAGALEIERVSFWFTGVKGQRQGMQGWGFGNRASSTESGRQEWEIVPSHIRVVQPCLGRIWKLVLRRCRVLTRQTSVKASRQQCCQAQSAKQFVVALSSSCVLWWRIAVVEVALSRRNLRSWRSVSSYCPCTRFVNPPLHLPFVEDQVCRSPS